MAWFRQLFTRAGNAPDIQSLAASIRPTVGDPFYVGIQIDGAGLRVAVEKQTTWLAGEITTVQTAVTAAVDSTPQTEAQSRIDDMPIFQKAIVLTLLDQINVLRAAAAMSTVTPAQALAAVRAKAATL